MLNRLESSCRGKSTHALGRLRDYAILEALQAYKVLDTDQIRILLFRNLSQGRRIVQKRLLSLFKRHRVKRNRDSYDLPCYYYLDKKDGQPFHRIGVNWVRLWLSLTLKSWEQLHSFDYEQDYGVLRSDGFAAVRNKITGKMTFFFVEFDNSSSSNPFDKATKYNALFESEPATWWSNLTHRFPAVVVVTTGKARALQDKIERDNPHGLEFRVYELDDIKEACEDAANKA